MLDRVLSVRPEKGTWPARSEEAWWRDPEGSSEGSGSRVPECQEPMPAITESGNDSEVNLGIKMLDRSKKGCMN